MEAILMEKCRKNLLRLIFISVITNICGLDVTKLSAEDSLDNLQTLFEQAYDYCHSEQFDKAIQLALEIREKYPDEPAGTFSLLTTYQTITNNYRVKSYEKEIDSLLNLSIKLAYNDVKKDKKNGKNYFYLGTAYGFRSLASAQNKEWIEAFKDGSKVMRNFNIAVSFNPSFFFN